MPDLITNSKIIPIPTMATKISKSHLSNFNDKCSIFGLSFTQRDLDIFQVESNDMKAIIFQRSATNTPKIDDTITWRGTPYKVVNISVIPADNGAVCQLRAYQ